MFSLCLLISLACSRLPADDRAKLLHGSVADAPAAITRQKDAADALETRRSIGPVTATLKEVLDDLAENGKIRIIVDTDDFKRIGVADVNAQQVFLPKLENVRFRRALQLALDQVGGTFITWDDDIIVGSQEALLPKKKIQLEIEFDKAERALRNQIEDLRDRRRLELAQLPQAAAPNPVNASADLDKRLEEIEHRLAAIEKTLEEKVPNGRKGFPDRPDRGRPGDGPR